MFLEVDIYLKSDKSLEEVGEILSKELFGGLPFGGRENSIRDEIPAIYIENGILGLEVFLLGGDVDGVSILQISPYDYEEDEKSTSSNFNFGDYLKTILATIPDVKIMSDIEIDEFEKSLQD